LAETVVLRIGLDALALQRAAKTGTRDAIEGEIEHQQMVLQQDFRKRAEMAFGANIADAEVGLGLHAECVGKKLVAAEQHIPVAARRLLAPSKTDVQKPLTSTLRKSSWGIMPSAKRVSRRRTGAERVCSPAGTSKRLVPCAYIELAVGFAGLKWNARSSSALPA